MTTLPRIYRGQCESHWLGMTNLIVGCSGGHFLPSRRMREVKARPRQALNVGSG